MEDVRQQVNEEVMDTQAARIDELERRLDALLGLLRTDSVCKALGVQRYEFDRTDRRDSALKFRPMKYFNERERAIDERRRKEVLTRLSHVSPERLEELLREK